MDHRDVIAPGLDIGVEPGGAAGGGAAGGEATVNAGGLVDEAGGGDQQFGAIGEVEIDRLAADPGRAGDIAHPRLRVGTLLQQVTAGLEDAGAGLVTGLAHFSIRRF